MTEKIKKEKKSLINTNTINVIEPKILALVVREKDLFLKLKDLSIGKSGATPALYGAGPLGYDGEENKIKSVFAGKNRAENSRFIIVFRGSAGVTLLESILQNEELEASLKEHAEFSRVEVEGCIPLSKETELSLFVDSTFKGTQAEKAEAILQELASELTRLKQYRPKAHYSQSKKALMLGSATTTQVTIAIEKSETHGHQIVFKGGFHATAAVNIYAATLQSGQKKVNVPIAMFIAKILSFVDVNPIMKALYELCSVYADSSVLLTKRQRNKIILNSKVIYAKGGLNSILKYMASLSEDQALQYAPILADFATNLRDLAKTNAPAKKAFESLQVICPTSAEPVAPSAVKKKGGANE